MLGSGIFASASRIALLFADSNADDMDQTQQTMLPSPESNQENSVVPTRKKGKRTAKFTKPKAAAKKTSATANAAGVKKATGMKKGKAAARTPLKDQTNIQPENDIEEVDDFDAADEEDKDGEPKATSGDELTGAKPVQKCKRRSPLARRVGLREVQHTTIEDSVQVQRIVDQDGEFEFTPTRSQFGNTAGKAIARGRGRPRAASKEPVVIPETQFDAPQIPSSMPDPSQDSAVGESSVQAIQRTTHFRAGSKQRQPYRPRAGSASSNEGRTGSDPTLRRRLGDVTRKLEALEVKYQNLRDIGVNEASENFSRLQTTAAAERQAASDVIASLKRDVATQRSQAQEAKLLQQQLATKDKDLESANTKADLLSKSLAEAQNEVKALQTRLSAQRSASVTVESMDSAAARGGNPPGSAVKDRLPQSNVNQQQATRTIMVGSAEVARQAQTAQLKEDLYADLTGLILRGVEKGDDGDVYDCIQTGRHGRGKLTSGSCSYNALLIWYSASFSPVIIFLHELRRCRVHLYTTIRRRSG